MNEDIYFKYSWKYEKKDIKFCPKCAREFSIEDVNIKGSSRLICHNCEFIFYLDPKLVVSAFILNLDESKVLLLKRAEEPQVGKWAFPGGYVERGGSLEGAIKKEVFEETGIRISPKNIIGTFSDKEQGIIEIVVKAIAEDVEVKTNIESSEGIFFDYDSIPYKELAFKSTEDILKSYIDKK